jgi:hypothetical protein
MVVQQQLLKAIQESLSTKRKALTGRMGSSSPTSLTIWMNLLIPPSGNGAPALINVHTISRCPARAAWLSIEGLRPIEGSTPTSAVKGLQ